VSYDRKGREDGIRTVEKFWGAFLEMGCVRLAEIALYIHIKYQSKNKSFILILLKLGELEYMMCFLLIFYVYILDNTLGCLTLKKQIGLL
jgi:hypothetical protein